MFISTKRLQAEFLTAYSIHAIRLMARDGVIPAIRVGRKFMFDPVDVVKVLKARAVRP